MSENVKFNIRGTRFETRKETLEVTPGTLFSDLDPSSDAYDHEKKEYFFDRDPEIFNIILNTFVHGKLHVPKNICGALLRDELEFWKVPHSHVSECCWRAFYLLEEEQDVLEDLRKANSDVMYKGELADNTGCRYRLWLLFDQPGSSLLAKIWHIFYISVVILSAIVFCLWTLPEVRTDLYLSTFEASDYPHIRNSSNSKMRRLILSDPHPALFALETFCLLIFTLELILRFIVCPNKIEFLKAVFTIVSVMTVLSMWIAFILEFNKAKLADEHGSRLLYMICKCCTMIRLLLLFRVEKQFSGLRVLLMSIKSSLLELLLMAVTFFIATLIFASMIYYAEIFEEQSFNNIFISMWWAVITMTTVGYGDYYPISTAGYMVGVVCSMCGLLLLALPVAIIASNFAEYYSRNKDRERCMKSLQNEKNNFVREKEIACTQNKVGPYITK